MDNNMERLHMVMDESDAPFEEGECPYERTIKNDLIMLEIYKSMGLELKADSDLAKLEKETERWNKRGKNRKCNGI